MKWQWKKLKWWQKGLVILAGIATCGLGLLIWMRRSTDSSVPVPLPESAEALARSERAARRVREARAAAERNRETREREVDHEIEATDNDPERLARLADGIADEHRRRRGG